MRTWIAVATGLFWLLAFGAAGLGHAQEFSELIEQSPFLAEEEGRLVQPLPEDGCPECAGACNNCVSAAGCRTCYGTDRYGCGTYSSSCSTCPGPRWMISTCDLYPHYPYFPSMHGYYYFRPYHHSHLFLQQQTAATWGGDPRNPYANEIFQQVYAQYRADRQEGAPAPEPLSLQQ